MFVVPLLVLSFTYSRITCEIWRCASSRHAPVLVYNSPSLAPSTPFTPCQQPPRTLQALQGNPLGMANISTSPASCQQAHAYAFR